MVTYVKRLPFNGKDYIEIGCNSADTKPTEDVATGSIAGVPFCSTLPYCTRDCICLPLVMVYVSVKLSVTCSYEPPPCACLSHISFFNVLISLYI